MKYSTRFGFTLIELMLAVAIIGLLSSLALPKFSDLVRKAREASTKGKLGALRSAVAIFVSDNEGRYPQMVHSQLTEDGKYLSKIPELIIPIYHTYISYGQGEVTYFTQVTPVDIPSPSWGYVPPTTFTDPPVANDPSDVGLIFIPCTHLDVRGTPWYQN